MGRMPRQQKVRGPQREERPEREERGGRAERTIRAEREAYVPDRPDHREEWVGLDSVRPDAADFRVDAASLMQAPADIAAVRPDLGDFKVPIKQSKSSGHLAGVLPKDKQFEFPDNEVQDVQEPDFDFEDVQDVQAVKEPDFAFSGENFKRKPDFGLVDKLPAMKDVPDVDSEDFDYEEIDHDELHNVKDPWDDIPDLSDDAQLYEMAKKKKEQSGIVDIERPEKEGLEYEPYMTREYYMPGYTEPKKYYDVPPTVGRLMFYLDNIGNFEGVSVSREDVLGSGDGVAVKTPNMNYSGPDRSSMRPTIGDFGNSFHVDTSKYRSNSDAWF